MPDALPLPPSLVGGGPWTVPAAEVLLTGASTPVSPGDRSVPPLLAQSVETVAAATNAAVPALRARGCWPLDGPPTTGDPVTDLLRFLYALAHPPRPRALLSVCADEHGRGWAGSVTLHPVATPTGPAVLRVTGIPSTDAEQVDVVPFGAAVDGALAVLLQHRADAEADPDRGDGRPVSMAVGVLATGGGRGRRVDGLRDLSIAGTPTGDTRVRPSGPHLSRRIRSVPDLRAYVGKRLGAVLR